MLGKSVLLSALLSVCGFAQSYIAPEHSRRLDVALQEAFTKHNLPCDVDGSRPFLDFAFRYEIGYTVRCPLRDFGGVETTIAAYLRVQPENNAPAWFSEWYRIPGIPDDLRSRINLLRDHNDVEFSGSVAAGEGDYTMDLVVVDRQHRLFHKNWKTRVYGRGGDARAPISMQPNTVSAVSISDWTHGGKEHRLGRLTVLVDAVPINTASNRLRAWDRAFFTEALSSVLKQLPSDSVRVIAFNLDQEREVFRSDDFIPCEAQRFADSLDQLELGKISYDVLQHSQGASSMLVTLLAREVHNRPTADAVVLLGPVNRLNSRIAPEFATAVRGSDGPPLFYVKYSPLSPTRFRLPLASMMGMREDLSGDLASMQVGGNNGDFPDIVQRATELREGLTLNVHSPADLADALKKIDRHLHASAAIGDVNR